MVLLEFRERQINEHFERLEVVILLEDALFILDLLDHLSSVGALELQFPVVGGPGQLDEGEELNQVAGLEAFLRVGHLHVRFKLDFFF